MINYTINNVGDINSIRYRSYYYDIDLGYYYLQSRYFDFATPLNKYFNAFWSLAMASEIAWGYDTLRNFKSKRAVKKMLTSLVHTTCKRVLTHNRVLKKLLNILYTNSV